MDREILNLKRNFERSRSFYDLFRLNNALKRIRQKPLLHPISEIFRKHAVKAFENPAKISFEFAHDETKNLPWCRITWELTVLGTKQKPDYSHLEDFFKRIKLQEYKLSNYETDYYGGGTSEVLHERPTKWSLLTSRRRYIHYIMLKFNIIV